MIETDVLIVGSGPAGGSAALMLSSLGVRNMLVTKHRWLADTPRAHITNQRTVEILRDAWRRDRGGRGQATPQHLLGNTVFCSSLAGEETRPRPRLGHRPDTAGGATRWRAPARPATCRRTLLEPILHRPRPPRAEARMRFDSEYVGLVQDDVRRDGRRCAGPPVRRHVPGAGRST
jgi:2,4-dichlorophenol 6-monooxygenase